MSKITASDAPPVDIPMIADYERQYVYCINSRKTNDNIFLIFILSIVFNL